MSTTSDKSYQKHKLVVKKWEKEFLKEHGRVPSKLDIREAPRNVKSAYKYYFNFKSQMLETSLMDVAIDEDGSFVADGFFPTDSQDLLLDNLDTEEFSPLCNIPSTEEIKHLMNRSEPDLPPQPGVSVSDKIWGKHLNHKKEELKKTEKSNSKINLPVKLLKSCSFNLRNPRKSLSSSKPNSSKSEVQTQEKSESSLNLPEKELEIPTSSSQVSLNKKDANVISLNPIQNIIGNAPSSRNINAAWLDRCSDVSKLTNHSQSQLENQLLQNKTVEIAADKPNNYGLKNICIPLDITHTEDSHLSDFVENSESEAEVRTSTHKKIKPVVKKIKLDESVVRKQQDLNSTPSNNKSVEKQLPNEKIELPAKNKNRLPKKSRKAVGKRQPVKRASKKNNRGMTSESECEDEAKVRPKAKRRSKKSLDTSHFDFEEDCENEYTNNLTDEKITLPRFPLSSSILKESNLVDSIAAALDVPKVRNTAKSAKESSSEDALMKKINDGTLNDNFVSLNLEKKVYSRGKKNMNYSKFKKQQWKNKKKMLHYAPEFPEGGVIKCFKCGQSGHMSRYCKGGKSGNLLPLDDCPESSPSISIQEAEELTNKHSAPMLIENVAFECIDSDKTREFDSEAALKGIHEIPDTFIKLLSSTPVTTNCPRKSLEPLYPLSASNTVINTPNEVKETLALFGHSEFRDGQEKAIMRILSGLSTLVTLSTGSGKSLCYQLPAYLYAKHNTCVTLVVSPLVSLMEDQVVNMPGFLQGVCLHTNQTPTQREKILELIKNGKIHILLVSPEAVVAGERTTGFGAVLRQLPPIAFACIDEVHCVSQWSHNFRPSYLMICRVLREKLGVKCILGLTATATTPTIKEIVDHLNIPDGIQSVITNKPLPDNLVLTVSRDCSKDSILLQLLKSERFSQCHSIIIYCIRRDECERVASLLRSSLHYSQPGPSETSKKRKRFNWVVEAYHAGMSGAKRKKVQQAFMAGDLRIVVATVAFGMGINKSDIRGVIHYNMPSSFESYVQEVGRAGRDGLTAQCHLFIGSDNKDKDELLRHIHANSIERHSIRKLLQRVFVPCGCNRIIQNTSQSPKCEGHEVAFAVDQTVSELDVPSENISTLLCYLELHPEKYAKVLGNVYIMCKIYSYGGLEAVLKAAEKCPPLAMALALEKKKGIDSSKSAVLEFCVIEVASAIGWESGVVKYHLKNLEWEKNGTKSKRSLLKVEFHTLGFRVKSPGNLTSSELDSVLDSLYDRTQLQEKACLHQLHEVFKAMSSVAYPTIFDCSEEKDSESCVISSNKLKQIIRNYFEENSGPHEVEIDERPINKDLVISDIRGLLSTYRDCTFTGRAVARILQGISSPNFPAIVWGRCRYWRSHLSDDFYKLVEIAKEQIISMR